MGRRKPTRKIRRTDDPAIELAENIRRSLAESHAFISVATDLFVNVRIDASPEQRRELARIAYLLEHGVAVAVAAITDGERRLDAMRRRP